MLKAKAAKRFFAEGESLSVLLFAFCFKLSAHLERKLGGDGH